MILDLNTIFIMSYGPKHLSDMVSFQNDPRIQMFTPRGLFAKL